MFSNVTRVIEATNPTWNFYHYSTRVMFTKLDGQHCNHKWRFTKTTPLRLHEVFFPKVFREVTWLCGRIPARPAQCLGSIPAGAIKYILCIRGVNAADVVFFFLAPSHSNYQRIFSPFLGIYKLSNTFVVYGHATHVCGWKVLTSYATMFPKLFMSWPDHHNPQILLASHTN